MPSPAPQNSAITAFATPPLRILLDPAAGTVDPAGPVLSRRMSDLEGLFADTAGWKSQAESDDPIVYTVASSPVPESGRELPQSVTTIYPGDCGGELYMTKGHQHPNPRAENYLGLTGVGGLLLFDGERSDDDVRSLGAEPAPLEQLAGRCDAVSLHAPGGRRVVDRAWLGRARPGLVLVNTARADLVDEAAVADALRSGRLGGYAADTLTTETTAGVSPLLAADLAGRVVITPHVGAQTVEAVDRMGAAATADVLAVLSGAHPAHPVRLEEGQ